MTLLSLADNSPKEGMILSATQEETSLKKYGHPPQGTQQVNRWVELTVGSYLHVMEVCGHEPPPFPGSPDFCPSTQG